MGFDDLSKEAQAKARMAETMEDLEALADENGHELSDEQLESTSGGFFTQCPEFCVAQGTCPKAVDMSGKSCTGYRFR